MPGKKRCGRLKGLGPKKAQLTAFIIIGILILAMGGALYYILSYAKKSEAEKIVERGLEVTLDEAKIREYITACIRKEGDELVKRLSEQGGTLNPIMFRYYFNARYNYFCIGQEGHGCVSRLITRRSMAAELDRALNEKMMECTDFSNFESQGYSIDEGKADSRSTIGVTDVNLEVTYPITISKDGQSVSLKSFTADIISRLGTLYDLAAMITYKESTEGRFDESVWMFNNGGITIDKHKPYPDIVYSLKYTDAVTRKEEKFNFAIKGRYTVYDIGKPSPEKKNRGYCMMLDRNCHANVNQGDCVKAGGEWKATMIPDEECTGLSAFAEPCEEGECDSCGRRKNGESWCEYEGLASPGFSPAGSRHYKGTCIDGKIHYTECRDYREEICIENTQLEVPKAVCRPNRWQDCAEQADEAGCTDNSMRDCWWSGWLTLNRQGKCIPYIPPGFMFWAYNGGEACAMANEQFDCNYYTCGQSWVDSSAMYCYFMGDCGNYRNVEGEITHGGFLNFDSTPSDYVYLTDDEFNAKAKPKLKMGIDAAPVLTGNEFNNPHGSINEIINNQIRYMDEVASWEYEDFRQSYIFEGKVYMHVLQTALCMPWEAPFRGKDCDECGSLNRPCTEYRCRSLGQTCNYEEINGIGFCYDYAEKDNIPPKLFFDGSTYGDLSIKQDFFGSIQGYKIDKPVEPYAPLFFMLNASEPVKCKTIGMPEASYDQIPFPASPFFNSFYVYTDIVPKPVDFRIGLMESLGITSFLELGSYETYDAKFQRLMYDARKFVKEFNGGMDKANAEANLDRIEKMWQEDYLPNIKELFDKLGDSLRDMAIQMQQGYKLVFFKCVDKAGNENTGNIFLKYRIGKDEYPPYVMGALPVNGSQVDDVFELVLSVNEPATCRYATEDKSYDSMPEETEMQCTTPIMEAFTRMYECRQKVAASGGNYTQQTKLFIRCRDKPTTIQTYRFNITKKELTAISVTVEVPAGEDPADYEAPAGPPETNVVLSHVDPSFDYVILLMQEEKRINLTPEWAEYISIPDVIGINTKVNEVEIVINVNEELDCRYSSEPGISFGTMEPMACEEGPEGIFPCSKKVNVADSAYAEVACMRKFEESERNTAEESTILSYSPVS